MQYLLPKMLGSLKEHDEDVLFKKQYFETRRSGAVEHEFVLVKPIAQWEGKVRLGFNVGTRSNGVDEARWPEDLGMENVR